MSTPRPSEADVEALARLSLVLRQAARDHLDLDEGEYWPSTLAVAQARAVLASDWLAARDAEHEREVAEAEVRGQMRHITAEVARGDQSLGEKEDLIADLRARLSHVGAERDSWRARAATNRDGWRQMLARAESAERALADLRGEVKALADEWEADYPGPNAACSRTPDEWGRDLRALLPRDYAAGGAS